MDMRRQVTGALAWAGLVIVIAVPSAEIVREKLAPSAALALVPADGAAAAPVAKPAKSNKPAVVGSVPVPKPARAPVPATPAAPTAVIASATPAAVAPLPAATAAVHADPIKDFLLTGKDMPDYITGSTPPKPAAAAPPAQPLPTALPPQSVASAPAAPPAAASAPVSPVTFAPPPAVASAPIQPGAASDTAVVPPPRPMPASGRPKLGPPQTVTEADLKDWKSGSLRDYLRQHDLLSNDDAAAAGN
jgi:hypothetical protein